MSKDRKGWRQKAVLASLQENPVRLHGSADILAARRLEERGLCRVIFLRNRSGKIVPCVVRPEDKDAGIKKTDHGWEGSIREIAFMAGISKSQTHRILRKVK